MRAQGCTRQRSIVEVLGVEHHEVAAVSAVVIDEREQVAARFGALIIRLPRHEDGLRRMLVLTHRERLGHAGLAIEVRVPVTLRIDTRRDAGELARPMAEHF